MERMRRTAAIISLFLLVLLLPSHPARAQDNAAPLPAPDRTEDNAAVPAPADAPPAAIRQTIRIAAVGDIMMGTTFPESILPPGDGATLFQDVRPLLEESDLVFGNLEGALTEGGRSPKCGDWKPRPGGKPCFAFRTPPRYAALLSQAGFTVMNVANNHALDFGMEGLDNTLAALAEAGIQATGGERVALFTVHGKRVAVAGFSYSLPTRYVYPLLDIHRAREIVADLKARYDLVVVSFHGGAEGAAALAVRDADEEFLGEKRGNPVRFARAVVDAGADLVLGHGPHVPRALEIYRGKLIAYSLGNFAVYSMFNIKGPGGLGYVLQVTLSADTGEVLSFRTPSVTLRHPGIPQADRDGKAEALLRKLSEGFLGEGPDADARREALFNAWAGE
jgi:poly-gamma-glutamate capsule biosynthesis protein CapA/YwtB (metallophosphatase superfamily)